MCSIDFSPFSFTWVSSRKDGHGRTEKLCLLTGMRGPSSGGCDRAVAWSTGAYTVGFSETFRCARGRVWSCLWALVGTLRHVWCVSQMGPSQVCAEMMGVRMRGPQDGFLWTHRGASWESLAWGSMMNEAVCQWPWISMGEIYLAPLGPFSVSTLIPGLLSFWGAYGSFSDQGTK